MQRKEKKIRKKGGSPRNNFFDKLFTDKMNRSPKASKKIGAKAANKVTIFTFQSYFLNNFSFDFFQFFNLRI